jgi:hypothetical protein
LNSNLRKFHAGYKPIWHKKTASMRRFFQIAEGRLITTSAATATTTAVAAAITAAATAVTTTTTTVAAAASAWGASFHGASDVDCEVTAADVLAVQASDSGLCFISTAHFHEAEAFGAAGVALHHDFGGLNLAKGGELLLQVFITHGVGEIADV